MKQNYFSLRASVQIFKKSITRNYFALRLGAEIFTTRLTLGVVAGSGDFRNKAKQQKRTRKAKDD